uniref:Uncharacterized protein n=1 Tax=Moniliophthora roreri TaxID=221103 RepID=A0A0W0GD04_MONRR
MAFLQGSSNAAIVGGQFTNIQGSQYNTNVYPPIHQERESTIWNDYRRVRTGDIYVTEVVGESAFKRSVNDCRRVVARRCISLARVEGKDKEFLYVAYDGPDAFKAFEMDFEQFSSVKHPNFAQPFGYSDNRRGLPALIFYDELIPLERVLLVGRRQVSPVLLLYFSHLFDIMQIANADLDAGELWVVPRTGALRRGPYIRTIYGEQGWPFGCIEPNSIPSDHFSSLSIQTYKDTSAVFDYLIRTLPIHVMFRGIGWSNTGVTEWLDYQDAIPVLRFFAGTIYNRHHRSIIAKYVAATAGWSYEFRYVIGMPDAMKESQTIMEDGLIRFMVTLMEIQDVQEMFLQYALYPDKKAFDFWDLWLTEAHSVFNQLGIHEDEWGDHCKCIFDSFQLRLQRKEHIPLPTDTTAVMTSAYLFIRPVPHPSDDETVWKSWAESENHFWSFDPSGQERMPEVTRASLGLPSFTSSLYIGHRSWSSSHYEAAEKLHRHCGFDPRTTDLAHSLGLPILEVIGDGDRFRILEQWEDSSTSSDILESRDKANGMEWDSIYLDSWPTSHVDGYTPSEESESDEEIIVYPRLAAPL